LKKTKYFIVRLLFIALLLSIPFLSIHAVDPATYTLERAIEELIKLLPEAFGEFAEGTLESRNQTELLKFQLRFWAAQIGDERLRDVIETVIRLPGRIAGLDVYDIIDIIFDKWEDIYAGVKTVSISGELRPSPKDKLRASDQVNLFKPSVPGPGVNNLYSLDGLKTKLSIQRKVLDDHFENIHYKYFDRAVNENGNIVDVVPVKNSVPEYIRQQKANLDQLEHNFDEYLSSANIAALLESINKQLVDNHKTNLLILEALTDLNKSVYYLSISNAYTNLENEFEKQSSRY